ncbi:MAG: PilZ domain-containing protein [Deltaproteobacteria bacterium]|nr:PilZ domain-containing protein [Deltaproteobacteria bacterium]
MDNSVEIDKRGFGKDRIRAHFLVFGVQSFNGASNIEGTGKNISGVGMFISTKSPFNLGEEFSVSFALPFDGLIINCQCQVAWAREESSGFDKEAGMGVKFLDLGENIKEKIVNWVMEGGGDRRGIRG